MLLNEKKSKRKETTFEAWTGFMMILLELNMWVFHVAVFGRKASPALRTVSSSCALQQSKKQCNFDNGLKKKKKRGTERKLKALVYPIIGLFLCVFVITQVLLPWSPISAPLSCELM